MKGWKKLSSLLLTVSLCSTLLSAGFPMRAFMAAESDIGGRVITGEQGINLVNNAGFEHGGGDEAEAWGKNEVEINTATEFVHSGSRSMKVAAGRTATAYAFSGLNDIYNREAAVTAGIWVYLSDAADADKTLIVLERKGGGDQNLLVRPQAQTGWQKVIFSGDAAPGCNEHVIKFEVADGNVGDIYFDDAFVYSQDGTSINLLRNGGFESQLDSFGQGGDGTALASGNQTHGGSSALEISGAKDVYQASGWWPNKQSANTGASLYFSAWVKSADASGSLKLRAEVKYGSPEQVVNYESGTVTGTEEWKLLWVEIPYPGDYIGEILFHIETTAGTGTFWVDDGVVSAEKPLVEEEDEDEDDTKIPGQVDTGEAGYNLLNNPGLERLRGDGGNEPFEDWGSAGIENAAVKDTRTGTGAVYAPAGANNGQTRFLFSGLNRYIADYTRELRASVWVRLADEADASKVKLICERKYDGGQKDFTQTAASTTQWQQLVLDMEPVEGCMESVLKLEVEGTCSDVWADDFYLSTKDAGDVNFLRNGKFEDGENAWANMAGQYAAGMGIDGSTALKLDLASGVDYFQSSGWWGGIPQDLSYTNKENMTYSVYVKSGGGSGVFRLRVERKEGNPELLSEFTVAAGDTQWKEVSLELPALETAPQEGVFHIEPVSGSGMVYFDNARLSLTQEAVNPPLPPDPPAPPEPSQEDRTPGVSVTGEEGVNALLNNGFELGEESWGFVNASVQEGDDKTHSGARAAVTEAGLNAAVWNVLPGSFFASGDTRVTGYVWLNQASDAGKVHVKYKQEKDGALLAEYGPTVPLKAVAGWQKVEIEVPQWPDQDATTAVVVVDVDAGADSVYLDDFFVAQAIEPEEPSDPPEPSREDRTPGVSVTGEEGVNALLNNGFELGEESWGFVNASVQEGDDKTHSGARAAVTMAGLNAAVWNVLPDSFFASGATRVTGYVWLNRASDAGKVHVKYKQEKDGVLLAEYGPTVPLKAVAGWQKVEIEVPQWPDQDATTAVVVVDVDAGADSVYLDDFFVAQAHRPVVLGDNYVSNGDFEQVNETKTEAAHWGLVPGWDTVSGAVHSQKVHGGSYAIRIPQGKTERYLAQSSNWIDKQTTPEYDSAKPMLLTAYVWYENLTGDGAFLKIEQKSGDTVKVYLGEVFKGSSGGWKRTELYLPSPGISLDENIVGLTVTTGSGVIYVDDISFHETKKRPEEEGGEGNPGGSGGTIVTPSQLSHQEVEQTGFNWLGNPGFEKDMQDWGAVGTADIVTDVVHQGEKSLRMREEAHIWNVVALNLDRSAELTFSFWLKLTDAEDAQRLVFYFARKNAQDEELERYTFSAEKTSEWQKISVVIPASEIPADILVFGADTLMGLLGSAYLDDCYLTYRHDNPAGDEGNLVANGSFEFGTDKPLAWGAIPEYDQGTVWVDQAKEGKLATELYARKQDNTALFQSTMWGNNPSYDYGAPLILTAYVKTESLQNGCLFKVERKYQDKIVGEPYLSEMVTGTSGGWKKVEVYLPPTDQKIDEVIVGVDVLPGSGRVLVDDVRMAVTKERAGDQTEDEGSLLKNPGLEKLNPDGSILHWDIWPGTPEEGVRQYESVTDVVHGGERALKIQLTYGNGQAVYQYRVMDDNPFDFNRDYEASVWVKMENVSVYDGKGVKLGVKRRDVEGNEHNLYTDIPLGSTQDWVQVKLPAPKADAEIIQYDVIVDIGAGSGTVYLDDFDLTETAIEPVKAEIPTAVFTKLENEPQTITKEQGTENAMNEMQRNMMFSVAGGISCVGAASAGVITLKGGKRRKLMIRK